MFVQLLFQWLDLSSTPYGGTPPEPSSTPANDQGWMIWFSLGTALVTLLVLLSKSLRDETGGWAETVRKIRQGPSQPAVVVETMESLSSLEVIRDQHITIRDAQEFQRTLLARITALEAKVDAQMTLIDQLELDSFTQAAEVRQHRALLEAWADWAEEAQTLIAQANLTIRPHPRR